MALGDLNLRCGILQLISFHLLRIALSLLFVMAKAFGKRYLRGISMHYHPVKKTVKRPSPSWKEILAQKISLVAKIPFQKVETIEVPCPRSPRTSPWTIF